MKPGERISYEQLEGCLGELIHTAFRKGTDAPQSDEIWHLIREMRGVSWNQIIRWIVWALPGEEE